VAQDLICLKIRRVIYEALFCLLEYQIRIKKFVFRPEDIALQSYMYVFTKFF